MALIVECRKGHCSKLIRVAYFACIATIGEISRLGLGAHRRRVSCDGHDDLKLTFRYISIQLTECYFVKDARRCASPQHAHDNTRVCDQLLSQLLLTACQHGGCSNERRYMPRELSSSSSTCEGTSSLSVHTLKEPNYRSRDFVV